MPFPKDTGKEATGKNKYYIEFSVDVLVAAIALGLTLREIWRSVPPQLPQQTFAALAMALPFLGSQKERNLRKGLTDPSLSLFRPCP